MCTPRVGGTDRFTVEPLQLPRWRRRTHRKLSAAWLSCARLRCSTRGRQSPLVPDLADVFAPKYVAALYCQRGSCDNSSVDHLRYPVSDETVNKIPSDGIMYHVSSIL